MLQPATRGRLIEEQHFAVERTSAHGVRLAAKVLLGKEDLPKIDDRTSHKLNLRFRDTTNPNRRTSAAFPN